MAVSTRLPSDTNFFDKIVSDIYIILRILIRQTLIQSLYRFQRDEKLKGALWKLLQHCNT